MQLFVIDLVYIKITSIHNPCVNYTNSKTKCRHVTICKLLLSAMFIVRCGLLSTVFATVMKVLEFSTTFQSFNGIFFLLAIIVEFSLSLSSIWRKINFLSTSLFIIVDEKHCSVVQLTMQQEWIPAETYVSEKDIWPKLHQKVQAVEWGSEWHQMHLHRTIYTNLVSQKLTNNSKLSLVSLKQNQRWLSQHNVMDPDFPGLTKAGLWFHCKCKQDVCSTKAH